MENACDSVPTAVAKRKWRNLVRLNIPLTLGLNWELHLRQALSLMNYNPGVFRRQKSLQVLKGIRETNWFLQLTGRIHLSLD